jgi:MYXO-CTERM domain-containing protein
MNFRALLAAVTLLPASAVFAATGDPCVANTFTNTCNADGSIQLCDTQTAPTAPVEASLTCADAIGPLAADASCGNPGCIGTCDDFGVGCVSEVGEKCIGFGVLFTQDPNDDQLIGSVSCAGDASCAVAVEGQAAVDRCVAHVGPACTAEGLSSCTGTVWSACLASDSGGFGLTSNIALDCSIIGSTCGEQPCECDAQCGSNGKCTAGVCEGGVTCIAAATDLPACNAGEGEGEGEGEGDVGGSDGNNNRDDQAEPAPTGTSCSSTSSAALPAFGVLAVALLSLRRRRR